MSGSARGPQAQAASGNFTASGSQGEVSATTVSGAITSAAADDNSSSNRYRAVRDRSLRAI